MNKVALLSGFCRRRRRRHHHHHHQYLLLRFLSTAAPSGATGSPSPISAAVAKTRLRREFDPDRAVSILSSVSDDSNGTSARYALDLTVRRLARARRLSDIESLLESRKSQPPSGAPLTESYLATIIISYGSARMLDHARRAFNDVPQLTGAPHSPLSLNALLSACIRAKFPRRVPPLFAELTEKHSISPDAISYSMLIKALCVEGKINKAFDVFKEMVEVQGFEPNVLLYTTLLDSLYKEKKPEAAEKLWAEMVEKGCTPDLPAYNVRIMYHSLNGKLDEVLKLIAEAEAAGLKPDTITYNYLISSYCKDGRFDEAKETYRSLRTKGCRASAAMYRTFLAHLCENGDMETCLEVFRDSLKAKKVPEFQTMKLLVESLVKAGKVDEAKAVIDQLRQLFSENMVDQWKKVEKELGLSAADDEVSSQVNAV